MQPDITSYIYKPTGKTAGSRKPEVLFQPITQFLAETTGVN